MPDDSVDLIVTSPPWNAKKNYGAYTDDDRPDFTEWLITLCKEMERVTKNAVYIFMNQDHMWTLFQALEGFHQWLFYHRRNLSATYHVKNPWIKTITPVAMSLPNGKISMVNRFKGISTMDIIYGVNPQSNYPNNKRLHPTQDLVEAYLPLVARTPCDVVYDPFLGSGTLAVTAVRLGKQWMGSEINPEYVEIAEQRVKDAKCQTELFTEQLDALTSE